MQRFMKNSYKRRSKLFILGLIFIGLLVIGVKSYNKKLYQVYINDRPVAVTAFSPSAIEETYGEVKALRYSQGATDINEELQINEVKYSFTEDLADKEELANLIYMELENENPLFTGINYQSYTVEREYQLPIRYISDSTMYVGESRIIEEGKEGKQQITVIKTLYNDTEVSEEIIENVTLEESVQQVVAVGSKKRPDYITPVTGYVFTSGFGARWGTTHQGIDLAVPEGTEVMAAADGVVIQSGWNGGYGISVFVDHGNGVVTRYGHMSQAYVQVGKKVTQGDVIGLSGNTGNSTGPHVHFEIRIGDEAVNPANYVDIIN